MATEGIRNEGRALGRLAASVVLLTAVVNTACASHSERTFPVRSALDAGDPRGAIRLLNQNMGVSRDDDVPLDLGSDRALYLLDRASVQQSLAQFDQSRHDFEVADKAIDMLDLAHDARDTIGEYVFSASSGKYQAPRTRSSSSTRSTC